MTVSLSGTLVSSASLDGTLASSQSLDGTLVSSQSVDGTMTPLVIMAFTVGTSIVGGQHTIS